MIYQLFVWRYGRGQASMTLVVLGSFVFMLIGAAWVGRGIESRFVLHGLLVGIVAVIYYMIVSLPNVLNGQYQNYFQSALIGHTPKLLGGIVGGLLAKRKVKSRKEEPAAKQSGMVRH